MLVVVVVVVVVEVVVLVVVVVTVIVVVLIVVVVVVIVVVVGWKPTTHSAVTASILLTNFTTPLFTSILQKFLQMHVKRYKVWR